MLSLQSHQACASDTRNTFQAFCLLRSCWTPNNCTTQHLEARWTHGPPPLPSASI
ncbi:hypothetical protein XENTR_v10012113 [Xenopus tropicalis]|nr:hypothetical protein XENTR_v10012113 [Xenopus tropicalis]